MKILLCMILIWGMIGCSDKPKEAEISAGRIAETLRVYLPEDAEEQDPEAVRRLLVLEEEGITQIIAYESSAEPEKLLYVIEAETQQDALKAAERLEYHAERLKNSAGMYEPSQLELIKNASVIVHDNYAVLVIAEDMDNARKAAAEIIGNE